MSIGLWLLGDQLNQAAVEALPQRPDVIILIEASAWVQQRRYHAQKLVLVWSAMRHFAAVLEAAGYRVVYREAEDFASALQSLSHAEMLTELWLWQPADYPLRQQLKTLALACPLTVLPNPLFLWSEADLQAWFKERKRWLLEDFYREGRRRWQVLLEAGKPVGDCWNYDSENRRPPKTGLNPPPPLDTEPDAITQAVLAKVKTLPTFGEAEPFRWAVSRSRALALLQHFCTVNLPDFGPYQDAMLTDQPWLWHALLSPYINLGLLHPLEVIQAAEAAYRDGTAPIASVEGFIRQVLGWREYMRAIYELVMPDYANVNFFNHQRPLPAFFWDGDTPMNCLKQVIRHIQQTGYAHHIQRLMILANFALISGIQPQAIEDWFHAVFIDAYDWVMQTNVLGMGIFADGGKLATKPYAASASYINKMSTYCQGCCYDPKAKQGERACPFNVFYWDFLQRHRPQLENLGRMGLVLGHLDRMSDADLAAIQQQALTWWETQS